MNCGSGIEKLAWQRHSIGTSVITTPPHSTLFFSTLALVRARSGESIMDSDYNVRKKIISVAARTVKATIVMT